ncbi:hypothetical protein R16034_04856 [Ralstonia edaphis]|uniref:Uncharacterized protein n=1 Tax=Ralstonia edaphi TaxID=3058599 RepID=A0AB72XCE1_9RALS|nr:hypothetical protein R16034_04856 [Ralstonia sp. LMG 6871]
MKLAQFSQQSCGYNRDVSPIDFETPMLQTASEPCGGFLIVYRERRYRTLQSRQKSIVAIHAPSS